MSTGVSPALQLPPIFIELGECQRRADAGDPEAQFQLGLRYMHGRQVDINRDKAVSWWTLAAKDRFRPGQLPAPGHPDAQCNLAVFLENKPGAAVAERLRAIELYQAAARQGHVNAMLNLADVYRSGRGVKRDDIWADRLVSQANEVIAAEAEKRQLANTAAAQLAIERAKQEDADRRSRGAAGHF